MSRVQIPCGPEFFSGLISTTRSVEKKKPFSATAKNQLQLVATGFAVIPCIQGVTEPIKRVLNSLNVKVALKPFRLWGIFSPNLRILSRKNNEPKPLLLFLAMTVTTNTTDRPNVSLVHV